MPGLKTLHVKPAFEPIIWMSLSGLLLLGTLVTTIDRVHLPAREALRANTSGQRAVIDPQTGAVSLSAFKTEAAHTFDVSTEPAVPLTPTEEAAVKIPVSAAADKGSDGLPTLRTEPMTTMLPAMAADALITAPAPEVTETIDGASLPKRNGTSSPASIYARHFIRTPDQHLLSFVIMDAGLSAQSLPLIMSLPKQVTVAFSPYAPQLTTRIAALRRAGFETWGMLPAMGTHYPQDDPGPLGLVSSIPADEMLRRLHAVMAATLGGVGLVLPPDETLSIKTEAFSPMLAEIDARGLNMLTTHPTRAVKQIAGAPKLQSPIWRADMVLDPEPDEAAIEKKLGEIETLLKTKEVLVVAVSARPQTLLILQRWLKEHPPKEPVMLAPLSAQWLAKEAPVAPAAEEKSEGGHGAAKEEKKSGGH